MLVWPKKALCPLEISAVLMPRSVSGGTSISGREQVVASDAGVWSASLNSIAVNGRNKMLLWRAIAGLLEGRLNHIAIPLCRAEWDHGPSGDYQAVKDAHAKLPHSDQTLFSDGAGYESSLIDVEAGEDANLRATSMTLSVTYAPDIQPGQIFSIDHPNKRHRWYKVTKWDAATNRVTFRPPLREAVKQGGRLEFDNPLCMMRLTDDAAMDFDNNRIDAFYRDLTFVEAP